MRGEYVEIDLQALTAPRDGATAMVDRWWLVRNGKPLVWVSGRNIAPQCNRQREVVDHFAKRDEALGAMQVPVAYWDDSLIAHHRAKGERNEQVIG